ncbi:MAG: DUF4445 domain-containing protein [Rhodospirillales bacterium]|nr:MAG: DUF4445 domain-containing protein [Rhodospirillales bacterium]
MAKSLTVTITDKTAAPDGKAARAAPDETYLEAAQRAGFEIAATCGGRGRCRSCRIKILEGAVPPPGISDRVQLGHDEVHERFRLACQTKVIADSAILIAPPKTETGHKILAAKGRAAGLSLDCGIDKRHIRAAAPADENERNSDWDAVHTAYGDGLTDTPPVEILRRLPALLRGQGGSLTVTTFNGRVIAIEAGDTAAHRYGMAFDIGTTSIVGSLIDLETGEELAAVGGLNPQAVHGGDLMSRIAYAQFEPKKLQTLRAKVLGAVNGFVAEACEAAGIDAAHIHKVVVVGNTVMHHVFLGIDPTHVGLAPYAPAVRDAIELPAAELPLKSVPNAIVCLLPLIAGFVGADTVAAVLATRLDESAEIRALVDIGTNGEVVMGSRDKLMACSAPAGPALEGAQIRHGMRGAVGAIEKVSIEDDVSLGVIGEVKPVGICGSGLIDAIAKMLESGVLDPSGLLRGDDRADLAPALAARLSRDEAGVSFALARAAESGIDEDISLSQGDIRQLQLAKGAICAGVMLLQRVMGLPDEKIAELMLCGGFGNYLDTDSAVRIRLLPPLPADRIAYFGNAAALGAQMALLSETERARASDLARRIEHVSLATDPAFQEIFVTAVQFPGAEAKPARREGRNGRRGRRARAGE